MLDVGRGRATHVVQGPGGASPEGAGAGGGPGGPVLDVGRGGATHVVQGPGGWTSATMVVVAVSKATFTALTWRKSVSIYAHAHGPG